MFYVTLFVLTYIFKLSSCDWVSDWMLPVNDELKEFGPSRRSNLFNGRMNENEHMVEVTRNSPDAAVEVKKELTFRTNNEAETSSSNLKIKIENTLRNAKALAEILKKEIFTIAIKENLLKHTIADGRSGVTTVTVTTMSRLPRTYIVRDGYWTLCNGVIQYPISKERPETNLFEDLFLVPRCIGEEVSTKPDPCVFNSVIKYDTIPTRRSLEYVEDNYLCLKPIFNNTIEQYMSIPKKLINETCKDGNIRSLYENNLECGVRVISEYTYYPYKTSSKIMLPLEYCTEKGGVCKMIIAWHISNSTVENFEFLKDEQKFKTYFIKPKTQAKHVI